MATSNFNLNTPSQGTAPWNTLLNDNFNAIDSQLQANRAAGGFIWRPGGTDAGNVFSTWAALYAALPSFGFRRITLDPDSMATDTDPFVIPAGSYDLINVIFTTTRPASDGSLLKIQYADGATISNFPLAFEGIHNIFLNTSTVTTISGVKAIKCDSVEFTCSGSSSPFVLADPGILAFKAQDLIFNTGAVELVDFGASGTTKILVMNMFDKCLVSTNSVATGSVGVVQYNYSSDFSGVASQSNFSGTEIETRLSKAEYIFYNEAASGAIQNVNDRLDLAINKLNPKGPYADKATATGAGIAVGELWFDNSDIVYRMTL